MLMLIQCKRCAAVAWARGNYDHTVNAVEFSSNEIITWSSNNDCEHEDFDIIESEEESFEDY